MILFNAEVEKYDFKDNFENITFKFYYKNYPFGVEGGISPLAPKAALEARCPNEGGFLYWGGSYTNISTDGATFHSVLLVPSALEVGGTKKLKNIDLLL